MSAGLSLRLAPSETAPRSTSNKPGLFLRIIHTLQKAQMRSAERKVAEFIRIRGGMLTDSVEREIGDGMRPGRLYLRKTIQI